MSYVIRIFRRLVGFLVILALVAVAAIAVVGVAPFGQRIVADEVQALISSPGRTIRIGTPSGLLTGELRVPEIELSDSQGVYARLRDVKVDWFPLALLKKTFRAEKVSAGSVEIIRPPAPVEADNTPSKPFNLPVAVDVQAIDLPNIHVSAAVAKRDFHLAAEGSAQADNQNIIAHLKAHRQDLPDAKGEADLAFMPGENRLTVKAALDEPRDGLISGMLNLPGNPDMHLTVNGAGPLTDWRGTFTAALDGNQAFTAEAHHQAVGENGHRIELTGKGAAQPLMPATVRDLFAGDTAFMLDATLEPGGKLAVKSGSLATASVNLSLSGTYDPNGQNDLAAHVTGINGPVPLVIPTGKAEARLLVNGLTLSLKGQAKAAALDLSAQLASADYPDYRLEGVNLSAKSEALNLQTRTGSANVVLSFEKGIFKNEALTRLAPGPFKLTAPLTLGTDSIRFDKAEIESVRLGGTLTGSYGLGNRVVETQAQLVVLPAALPDAAASRLKNPVSLKGSLTYHPDGAISVSGLDLKTDLVSVIGEAGLSKGQLRADLKGRLPDISSLVKDAKGGADFTLTASGAPDAPDFKLTLKTESAILSGRELKSLSLAAEGKADRAAPQAHVKASGSLSGQVVNVDADLRTENGTPVLPVLKVDVGPNHIDGNLRFTPDFLPIGNLNFTLPDISLVAALAGQKVSGDLSGEAAFDVRNGVASAKVNARGKGVQRDTISVKAPDVSLDISDLKALAINGRVKAGEVSSGANRLTDLSLDFNRQAGTTKFGLKAGYDGKPVSVAGDVSLAGGRTTVNLANASASPKGIDLKLQRPTAILVENGAAQLNGVAIQAGKGSVTVTGKAGSTLDVTANIQGMPLALANTFQPSLQADGTLSGTVKARGNASSPVVDYQLSVERLAVAQTRSAGLQPLAIKADGQYQGNQVKVTATASNGDGLKVSGGGTAAIAGNKALNLTFNGSLPFKAVSPLLAAQGFELTGTAAFDVKIAGTTAAPAITGKVSSGDAQLVDVRHNIAIKNLALSVTLDRTRATIEKASGTLSTGGTVSATGSVGFQPGSSFPADIKIALNKAAYVDGKIVSTVIDGNLTLTGPLIGSPKLSGKLALGRSAVTIPQKLPASLSQINVKHRNPSKKIAEQTADVMSRGGKGKSGASGGIGLDLTVSAPRIFVQGRGIDAELGGDLTLAGSSADPTVSGGFKMQRGRIVILSRRLDFTAGTITFGGDLTPELAMAAEATAGSTTVTVNVDGPANDPAITFSSSPTLPQDEILAQLIFQQSLSRLSALQIAQLADAAAQLAGGRSTSLLQSLRSNLGIDDLDITSDPNGNAQLRAGKYLNDKTYIQVEQGGSSGAKASINLDVGRGIKLKGEAGAGGGAAGIFYEKEY